jgi:hypothetical protein
MKDLGEEKKTKECLLISTHVKQFYSSPEMENPQIFANFQNIMSDKGGKRITFIIFKLKKDKISDETGFERAGELLKLSKNREFKKKMFELSKKQLIYYKPKEKGINPLKKVHAIK